VDLFIVVAVVVIALGFDYTNGFHDAANAIATAVSTRALTPRVGLRSPRYEPDRRVLGQKVARPSATRSLPPEGNTDLVVVHVRAHRRDRLEPRHWYFGLPSSSSHALIGGLIGAGIAVA
jgi:PiT family inorganic phosphate transporter